MRTLGYYHEHMQVGMH